MTVPVEWTDGMIHIVGTDPYFQVSTTVKRRGAAKQEMAKFQRYLSTAAKRLGAAMIAEEASAEWVKDHGPGAISVARRVAAQMRVRHRYCDPDRGERRACGLGFDLAHVHEATTHEVIYQSVMRTSLRCPDVTNPVTILITRSPCCNKSSGSHQRAGLLHKLGKIESPSQGP